jgi:hypothetical protein
MKLRQNNWDAHYLRANIAAQRVAQIYNITILASLPATAKGYGPLLPNTDPVSYMLDNDHGGHDVRSLIKLNGAGI